MAHRQTGRVRSQFQEPSPLPLSLGGKGVIGMGFKESIRKIPFGFALVLWVIAPSSANGADPKLSGDNVLFVTFDTTRADRFGCYGDDKAVTPTLDALAAGGVLFEQAQSAVPLTLPSHASLLTGRYPREHGVHNNGREGVGTELPTLATIFKEKGYKTGAFVASFVLDSRYGLDRGFDVYDDDMGTTSLKTSPLERERPANVVTDSTLAWLETVKSDRFFAWVHFYDPHDPYQPPAEFHRVGRGPYDAEIAFADSQLGRLVKWLEAAKLRDRTLIVMTADHGEAFGEHGEIGHSLFLSDAVLRVPMVFNHPKVTKPGTRVGAVVETLDIFPTILDLFGWDKPEYRLKRSFASALRGETISDRPAFAECLYVYYTYKWAEQRSVTTKQWKYISSTRPQLFDRRTDEREKTNVLEREKDIAENLSKALKDHFASMTPVAAKAVELSPEDRKKLHALGYAGSGGLTSKDFLTPGLQDPKDHIETVNKVKRGQMMVRDGHAAAGIPLLEIAAAASPDSPAMHASLGNAYLRLVEEFEEINTPDIDPQYLDKASESLEKVLKLDETNEMAMLALGDVRLRQQKPDEAIVFFQTLLNRGGEVYSEVYGKLAQAHELAGHRDQSLPLYQKAVKLNPEIGPLHLGLASIYADQGRDQEALGHFHEAVRLSPKSPDAHFSLGIALLKINQNVDAASEFEQASVLRPKFGKALINWGIALYNQGEGGLANLKFLEAAAIPEFKADANFNLGITLAKDGRKMDAVNFMEKALRANSGYAPAIEELTRYYAQMKRPKDVVRVLRLGAEHVPNDVKFTHMLAKVLATAETESVRNGADAVKFATRAAELTHGSQPTVQGTLAAAYAETGDFPKAIETATNALALAKAANQTDLAATIQSQLDGYKEKKPVRNPEF